VAVTKQNSDYVTRFFLMGEKLLVLEIDFKERFVLIRALDLSYQDA